MGPHIETESVLSTSARGVGYTDTPDDAEYLKNKGYTVEGETPTDPDPLAGCTAKELIAYATDHGIDLTGISNNKGKILAAIRAVEPLSTEETKKE